MEMALQKYEKSQSKTDNHSAYLVFERLRRSTRQEKLLVSEE
jgi:hypothetical protein